MPTKKQRRREYVRLQEATTVRAAAFIALGRGNGALAADLREMEAELRQAARDAVKES